ncbi:acyl-CoA dehydrogenase family protein [Polyangium sp. 15x6]|uniref:acyl-CoA dehydrogenase family protein n=1 Tax=Polyangium sp. 15x6 TaxID=3042687 RepID=UPI00249B20B5|nr:acyl-CoA dehydrogenase family protein [Polyangium sp. 15x6]MDI3291976.1 acyl-CoA dehydrogenase family protein [Polyangium sp. 15x6]
MTKGTENVLETSLLASVARVRSVAEAHADASNEGATLHPAVVEVMKKEGLFALAAPKEVGGQGADGRTQLVVYEAMAHADPSAGWALMIGAIMNGMMGAYLPEAATREIFAAGMTTSAGLQVPTGKARRVDGGFEVTGRWGFGSGIRHASWVYTAAMIEEPTQVGPPSFVQVAVPVSRVTIEDTWNTAFLRGSGSNHYRMESVFVDEAFTCSYPCASRKRGQAYFELPFIALVAPGHIGFALGVARRALEEITIVAPRRIKAWTGEALGTQSSFRVELGRKRAALDAARALGREVIELSMQRAEAGRALSPEDWAAVRAATTYTTEVAADVTSFAFRAGGSSAIYAGTVLDRCFRDVHAAAQHIAATDDAYDYAARVSMGEAPFNPLLLPRESA